MHKIDKLRRDIEEMIDISRELGRLEQRQIQAAKEGIESEKSAKIDSRFYHLQCELEELKEEWL